MADVAKKEYLKHPVKSDWCADVKVELKKLGRGSQKRLLEFVNQKLHTSYSSGHLSDVLKGKYASSDMVGPIHEFLGWTSPMPPTTSRDAGELAHLFVRLTPEQRDLLDLSGDDVKEMSGDQARDHLAKILDLLSGSKKSK